VAEEAPRRAGLLPRVAAVLGIVVSVLAVLGGGSALLFSLRPGLKPCLGGSEASFTGVPVFPRVRFRDHLIRQGRPREQAAQEPNILGAEVRFSYRIEGFRGAELPLTWSLVTIQPDGTLGAVVPLQDRALAMTVAPDACSEGGGKDLWVQIPDIRKRYRIVLELYRDEDFDDRLALAETPIFHG
jgi:hypothetical protein